MATDQVVQERNALLDELTVALDDWYNKELEAIDAEAGFMRQVVKARSSASALSSGNVDKGKVLVIDDITSFLAGL